MGNFKFTALGQGICSSGDLFNYITDGNVKLDEDFDCLKNNDDFLLYSNTLEGLQEQIGKLMKLCKRINLKLSPAKFKLSEAVKFRGIIISAEKIKEQSIIFLDPPDARILALTEMPAPTTKKELQSFCGMVSSLKAWFPNVSFFNKNLRVGTTQGTKFVCTPYMQEEFVQLNKIFQDQIRLSPFDPEKEINILCDGASSKGIGYIFYQNANENKPGEDVMIVK